jgi:hypothetical protein
MDDLDDLSVIVGMVDDDTNLRGRYLHGYKVLGTLSAVPELIEQHQVTRIIVTTRLDQAVAVELVRLCAEKNVKLLRWKEVIEPLSVGLDCGVTGSPNGGEPASQKSDGAFSKVRASRALAGVSPDTKGAKS